MTSPPQENSKLSYLKCSFNAFWPQHWPEPASWACGWQHANLNHNGDRWAWQHWFWWPAATVTLPSFLPLYHNQISMNQKQPQTQPNEEISEYLNAKKRLINNFFSTELKLQDLKQELKSRGLKQSRNKEILRLWLLEDDDKRSGHVLLLLDIPLLLGVVLSWMNWRAYHPWSPETGLLRLLYCRVRHSLPLNTECSFIYWFFSSPHSVLPQNPVYHLVY